MVSRRGCVGGGATSAIVKMGVDGREQGLYEGFDGNSVSACSSDKQNMPCTGNQDAFILLEFQGRI
jgi:hypothetical protein